MNVATRHYVVDVVGSAGIVTGPFETAELAEAERLELNIADDCEVLSRREYVDELDEAQAAGELRAHRASVDTTREPTLGQRMAAGGVPVGEFVDAIRGELAEEVAAATESARVASIDPSDRAGFSRRVTGLTSAVAAALAVAMPATASPVATSDPCAKPYPAPATIVHHGRLLPLHPVLADYARCVRAPIPTTTARTWRR